MAANLAMDEVLLGDPRIPLLFNSLIFSFFKTK
jgi:hypothetical protein